MQLPPRTPGWHSRLYAAILGIAHRPHRYGQLDCALLVALGVDAMHGTDLTGQWRGRYTTYTGGLRVLRRAGYRDPLDMLGQLARQVPAATAQIGDIAVVDLPTHPALGWVMGQHIQLLRVDGLVSLPLITAGPEGAVRTAREVWRT